jgi:3-hydroxyacyl-[acyl-carrier-protein] dehydratase
MSETSPNPSAFDGALDALPHGPSFRFVDSLSELTPGKAATGSYLVRGDEAFLEGHFPGQPMMPGVLLCEAIAQLAGVAAQSDPEIPPLKNMRLTAIRAAKILGTAEPGETMTLQTTIAGRLGPLVQAEGSVTVGDRLLLKTQVTLSGEE